MSSIEGGVGSLSSISLDSLVGHLGQTASDTEIQVHCGGSLKLSRPAKLFTGNEAIEFPLSPSSVEKLRLNAEPATFGRGKQSILDEEYRQAMKISSDCGLNFDLANWSVLAQIKEVLLPHSNKQVLAQLDKVNLYSDNGFFKDHKDTPRSQAMFASLVLCLPSPFEGGQLVIKHRSGQKVYDWGTAAHDSHQVQWAAFYSDCTHEILPITQGVRVTVTYNLYVDDNTIQDHLKGATTKFSDELAGALKQPEFLSDGGILGFACEHSYPKQEKVAGLEGFLKGADAVVVAAARTLDLDVDLLPVWKEEDEEDEDGDQVSTGGLLGNNFAFYMQPLIDDEDFNTSLHQEVTAYSMPDITWCTSDRRAWAEDHVIASYGNEPSTTTVYSAAAILIHVPAWSERKLP